MRYETKQCATKQYDAIHITILAKDLRVHGVDSVFYSYKTVFASCTVFVEPVGSLSQKYLVKDEMDPGVEPGWEQFLT